MLRTSKGDILVWSKEEILEEFAGDLEFHPRRGVIYALFGGLCLVLWYRLQVPVRFAFIPPTIGYGGLALILKSIFLFRKSSDSFGATRVDLVEKPKARPSGPVEFLGEGLNAASVGQFIQDFGAGSIILWPFLALGAESTEPLSNLKVGVFAAGAATFALGWALRKAGQRRRPINT